MAPSPGARGPGPWLLPAAAPALLVDEAGLAGTGEGACTPLTGVVGGGGVAPSTVPAGPKVPGLSVCTVPPCACAPRLIVASSPAAREEIKTSERCLAVIMARGDRVAESLVKRAN